MSEQDREIHIIKNKYKWNWLLEARYYILRVSKSSRLSNVSHQIKNGFSLKFADCFDGKSWGEIDENLLWIVGGSNGSKIHDKKPITHYVPPIHTGDTAEFIANYDPKTIKIWDGREFDSEIAVSKINTQYSFKQQFGRFEHRGTLPLASGTHSAFWIWGMKEATVEDPEKVYFEIDIREVFALADTSKSGVIRINVHGRLPDTHPEQQFKLKSRRIRVSKECDVETDYHEYACEWERDEIRMYVDSVLVFKFRNQEFLDRFFNREGCEAWMVLNNNVRTGLVDVEAIPKYSSSFISDYVRGYQFNKYKK